MRLAASDWRSLQASESLSLGRVGWWLVWDEGHRHSPDRQTRCRFQLVLAPTGRVYLLFGAAPDAAAVQYTVYTRNACLPAAGFASDCERRLTASSSSQVHPFIGGPAFAATTEARAGVRGQMSLPLAPFATHCDRAPRFWRDESASRSRALIHNRESLFKETQTSLSVRQSEDAMCAASARLFLRN